MMRDPVTIADWKVAQLAGNGLSRLFSLRDSIDPTDCAFISIASKEHIQAQWDAIQKLQDAGNILSLFGIPFAAKDNIDIVGLATTAACPDFSFLPTQDAGVIQVLKRAGAILIGKTNLDAFATGLVGTRSPYGAVPNTFDPKYISGGSSSGSASVVARGIVPFALGTDTAGSGRVPAGLNNIVGLKATRGALSARGVLPACRTLDCVSILALTIDDAKQVFDVAAQYDADDAYSRSRIIQNEPLPKTPKIAICDNPPWFGQALQSDAYIDSLKRVEKLGWNLEPTSFTLLFQLANLLYEGPWVAERYFAIKEFIERPGVEMDPVVRSIIQRASKFNAVDLFENEYLKADLIRAIEEQFGEYDAILVPTTPTFPTMEDLRKEPVLENSRLGTYTNFVNFLDWTALSIPAGFRSDGLPFGLTIISTRWQEEKLMQLGTQFLCTELRKLGVTKTEHQKSSPSAKSSLLEGTSPLVVVGAHLTGFPLNHQLTSAGATLNSVTATSPSYRLYDLPSANGIKKPGLKRITNQTEVGYSIQVEVWNLSHEALGKFLLGVPPPLAIGSVELADGNWLKGFVCEPWGLENAMDISSFGGWRAYIDSLKQGEEIVVLTEAKSEATTASLFAAVLIANRGEIAARIIKTLKKLGIKSIAVFSNEDSKSQHVQDADESYLLPGDTLASTYLSGDAIIEVAKKSGAEAIIPGYGFLSESSEFAEACESNNLVWIGPTPKQMHDLGLKHLARDLAQKAGIPLLPGTGLLADVGAAVEQAKNIGYPIIVKSSAGGGGIGLQQCNDEQALRDSYESIQHLGQSFFKDSSVFLEKFVEDARHVEVQIIGDGKGSVKHAGERDCSLQRRKQKVVEEGPAVFVPEKVRRRMRKAAIELGASVCYRGVGTVEFIYDIKTQSFYFLEVNTRLQVEHPVTEAITGLDLVEAMVRIAGNDSEYLFSDISDGFSAQRVAIEARIYSESPLQGFRPSTGQLLNVSCPADARVDTWVSPGSVISPSYDPLLAKIIVSGYDRPEAVRRLSAALDKTLISGVETNIEYLKRIIRSEDFQNGTYTTTSLDSFKFSIPVFEVLDPGPSTTIQDFPGRQGFWHVGIPPSGPMDDYAFRMANRILGNDLGAAALECTRVGPKLLFHHDAYVAVVGGPAELKINGMSAAFSSQHLVNAGQTLQLGVLESGCRAYIAIKGGIDVPEVFGSRSTFVLGKIGGYCGRLLGTGDMISFHESTNIAPEPSELSFDSITPKYANTWTVKVMPGPHAFPDYFLESSYQEFFTKPWKVHYNSNRIGVRLSGPKPGWARENGGAAGLHPSNIHDSPYSIGSISFTGDEAVILTCDGPSLGGFVVFATIISAEMWKIGQMKPGDKIFLSPVTASEALHLNIALSKSIETATPQEEIKLNGEIVEAILGDVGSSDMPIICRQAGDHAVLLEFGEADFNIRTSFQIYALLSAHLASPITGISEFTPGVRSLHVSYDSSIPQASIVATLRTAATSLLSSTPPTIPSRTFYLPLSFEHSSTLAAITRYAQTIRSTAPWLPSNVDFLRQINGLATIDDVNTTILSATYLVLGLGDVFFGSPCAVPLDPRQRLFGMKYNPSRSFTPEGSVGVGGQYMCIYGIDSPGGYQLVGRTMPIWQRFGSYPQQGNEDLKNQTAKPWMFNLFDQIRFYPVSEETMNTAREKGEADQLVRVEDGVFDLQAYEAWLESEKEDIKRVMEDRWKTLHESDAVALALQPPPPPPMVGNGGSDIGVAFVEEYAGAVGGGGGEGDAIGGEVLRAGIAGKCWKSAVSVGEVVEAGQVLFWIEAMKMEIKILAPAKSICKAVLVKPGDLLTAESVMARLEVVAGVESVPAGDEVVGGGEVTGS